MVTAGASSGVSAARATPAVPTDALITKATMYSNFIDPRFFELEVQPHQQVQSVVVGRGAVAAIIAAGVVAVLTVDIQITDILCLQLGVEPRQVVNFENVAV